MNYQVGRSKSAINAYFKKKQRLTKLIVIAISVSYLSLNSAVSYAQMTMDGSATTDTVTDTAAETTTETAGMDATTDTADTSDDTTAMDDSTDATDSPATVVDLVEGTNSEETPPAQPVPEPEESGGGGGGGGAILALVAIGAVVFFAVNSSKKKEPKIQKTFLADQVSGIGTELIEISSQSSYLEQGLQPSVSFQYGSYQSITGFDKPYSFFNLRYQKPLGSRLSFNADAGTRYFAQNSSQTYDSQWLGLGFSSSNLFTKQDRLAFTARYATGDIEENSNSLSLHDSKLEKYDAIFSEQNAQLELAYSRTLGQNQRLRFLVQKLNASAEKYAAKLAWRYAF